MRSAAVTPEGGQIRWVELPGQEPSRVYVHGLGATSPAYFAQVAARRKKPVRGLRFQHTVR